MFIKRKILAEILPHLQTKYITVIVGMRRVGKTTMMKYLLNQIPSENKLYLDLERIDNQELFKQKNFDLIIKSLERLGVSTKSTLYLALDEIQAVKDISSVIRYLYDNYDIKFILTGSSSYYLKDLFSESLAGRKKVFELYPLDFGEFLLFKKVKVEENKDWQERKFSSYEYEQLSGYYEEYVKFGGFPEIALEKDQKVKKDLLLDIISSYIHIDIKTLGSFDYESLYSLLKILPQRVGSKIDYSKIAKTVGISRLTVKKYLDFLEKTYFIRTIPIYSANIDKRIAKAKKLYFLDNGLLNVLGEVSSGAEFENSIFTQLHHHGTLYYYQRYSGQEIDFILLQNKKTIGLEVKEIPIFQDKVKLERLKNDLSLDKAELIGRFPSPKFQDYIWAGSIR